jgi:nitrite reductase/ring-hydroxylating ferredoxin subunit
MRRFVKVAHAGDIEPGTGKTVNANGTPVALFNVDGVYHAIHNTCPHEDGPLGEGELSGSVVTCPWHAYEFDVTSGGCLTEPAYRVERFEVRVDGDDILLSERAVDD